MCVRHLSCHSRPSSNPWVKCCMWIHLESCISEYLTLTLGAAVCHFMDLLFVRRHVRGSFCCCCGNLFLASDINAHPLRWQRPHVAATIPVWLDLFVLYGVMIMDTLYNRNWGSRDTVSDCVFLMCYFAVFTEGHTVKGREGELILTDVYNFICVHSLICWALTLWNDTCRWSTLAY